MLPSDYHSLPLDDKIAYYHSMIDSGRFTTGPLESTGAKKMSNRLRKFIDYLPHGSGIDERWNFHQGKTIVTYTNEYHEMRNGMYTAWIPFFVTIPLADTLELGRAVESFKVKVTIQDAKNAWEGQQDYDEFNDEPYDLDWRQERADLIDYLHQTIQCSLWIEMERAGNSANEY